VKTFCKSLVEGLDLRKETEPQLFFRDTWIVYEG